MVVLVVVFILVTAADIVVTQDQNIDLKTGIDSSTCGEFATVYEHNPHSDNPMHNNRDLEEEEGEEGVVWDARYSTSDYIVWLEGYLASYYADNQVSEADKVNVGGMLNSLYRWCSSRPDAKFVTSVPVYLNR
jgi:hypothetical protein